MKIRDANDSFALEMKENGHSMPFAELTACESREERPAQVTSGAFSGSPSTESRKPIASTTMPTSSDVGSFGRQPTSAFGSSSTTMKLDGGLSTTTQPSASFGGLDFGTTSKTGGDFLASVKPSVDSRLRDVRPLYPQTTAQPSQAQLEEHFQSITSREGFKDYSFEEPRLSDRVQAQLTLATPDSAPSSLFGKSDSSTANKLSVFGGTSAYSKDQGSQLGATFGSGTQEKTARLSPFRIYQLIREEVKACRGTELQGTINPDVLPILFHNQARKWKSISEAHFFTATTSTYRIIGQILDTVCTDTLTRRRIGHLLLKKNQESKSRGLARLLLHVDDVLSRHLQTNNSAFEDKVSEARRLRFHAALERYRLSRAFLGSSPPDGTTTVGAGSVKQDQLVIDMRETSSLFAELHISNAQNLEDEIHDTLKAYYNVARDEFIEYVNKEVVEPYLNDAGGPVLFFSPIYVAGLKDEDIEALAAEDEDSVRKRAEAEEKLARLNRAERIALEYGRSGVVGLT